MITTEWLTDESVEALNPLFEAEGWTPLNRTAVVLVAKDEYGLAGFITLRMVPHSEPLWVREDLRGSGLAEDLAQDMYKFLKDTNTTGMVVIADSPAVAKLCESFGMRKIDSPVYIL